MDFEVGGASMSSFLAAPYVRVYRMQSQQPREGVGARRRLELLERGVAGREGDMYESPRRKA